VAAELHLLDIAVKLVLQHTVIFRNFSSKEFFDPVVYGRVLQASDMENGNNIIVDKLDLLTAKDLRTPVQKDSSENKYFGDIEKIAEEEFMVLNTLDYKKLQTAYL